MKRNLILLFCALLGLAWYTSVSDAINEPKNVKKHIETAQNYEEQGIYVDAISEYEQALSYRPGDLEISLQMAKDYLETGSSQKFTSICKELLENNPTSEKVMDCLMNYYVENHAELTAVRYLSEFQEAYPESACARQWMLQLEGSYQTIYCFYDELSNPVFDTMVVKKDELYGITNSKGEAILEPLYEEVHPYSQDGLALIKQDGSYIYVDQDGQTRLNADSGVGTVGMMASKRTVALKNGKYAYLDEKLQPVTEYLWDGLTQIEEKTGAGKKGEKWALLDNQGKEKTEYVYEDVICDENGFCSFQKRIFVKASGMYQMINTKGEVQGELVFEAAKAFTEEGYAAVCQNGKWGFVNTDGELVIECAYEEARSFSNGFAAVCRDGLWGYIDAEGHQAIEPQFESAGDISSAGTTAVKNEKWTLIQLNLFQ